MKLYQKKLFENYSRTRGVEFVDGIKDVAMVRSHFKMPVGFSARLYQPKYKNNRIFKPMWDATANGRHHI